VDRKNDRCEQCFREFDAGDFSASLNSGPGLKLLDHIGLKKLSSNKRLGLFTSWGSGMRQHFLMLALVQLERGVGSSVQSLSLSAGPSSFLAYTLV